MKLLREYWYNDETPIGPYAVFPNLDQTSILITPTPPLGPTGKDYNFDAPNIQRNRFIDIHLLWRC